MFFINVINAEIEGSHEKWICLRDIYQALGVKNKPSCSLNPYKMQIIANTKDKYGNLQHTKKPLVFVSTKGLYRIISTCRKPTIENIENLCNALSLPFMILHSQKYENAYINNIINILPNNIHYETQFHVGKYKIDLYIYELNMCIECDENGHTQYNQENEIKRQEYILQKLNCKIIRFNPDAKDFTIFNLLQLVVDAIYKL
jgi:very-short-patch-repair endonuclease